VAPNGKFLYVSTTSGIFLYTIGSGGALTLKSSTAAFFQDDFAYTIAVDPSCTWLLDASALGVMYAIPISSTDGTSTLPAGATTPTVQLPGVLQSVQIAISGDDKNVFVAQGSSGTAVVPFTSTANVATTSPLGTASQIKVSGAGGSALSVAVDPSATPRLLYIGETVATTGTNTGGLRVINYSSMTEVSGSPFASGGLAPTAVLPKSTGDYVYVANRTVSGSSTGNIAGFAVTASGAVYSVTKNSSTASAGTNPVSLAEDNLKNYVLVVDSGGSPDLEGYTFDTTTLGKLDSAFTTSTGTDPVGAIQVVAAP